MQTVNYVHLGCCNLAEIQWLNTRVDLLSFKTSPILDLVSIQGSTENALEPNLD